MLKKVRSKVSVTSILLEEDEHLHEMIAGSNKLPSGMAHAEHICRIENVPYHNWIKELMKYLH